MGITYQGDGTLTNTTPVKINLTNNQTRYPATVVLKSAAGGRLIRFSVDGGNEFFIPTVDADASSATQRVVSVTSPITNVEFTGQAGDTWMIL